MAIAIPYVAFAFYSVEPTPVIYEQEFEAYTKAVVLLTSDDADKPSEAPPTIQDEGVSVLCSCVTYLREIHGINIRGDAIDIKSNTDVPIVGGVVLFDYNGVGHASLIKYRLLDRLIVTEANYTECEETERVVMLDDVNIRGYYIKNPNMVK